MATIGGTRALYSAQAQFKREFDALLREVATYATGVLTQAASPDGSIDPSRLKTLKQQIGQRVESVFVPLGTQEGLAQDGRGLAPYGRLLMRWISYAVANVVDSHRLYMERSLPQDVQRWLTSRVRQESVSEAANPLAQYEAPHEWVDPSGYQLSDRIWRAGVQTRLRIDALLSDGIRSGTASRTLSAQLEQFLLPTRASLRTKKPYGSDASLDGMRLARSEIARAHGQAAKIAGITNPFVTGMDWALSASHPKFDVCDGLATIGMDGSRIKEPYPPETAPVPVQDSHSNCICNARPFVTSDRASVVADLRAQMDRGDYAPNTPLNMRGMLTRLLGAYLANEALQRLSA